MFNPDLKDVLKNHLSRYSLVTATAKRARAISDDAIENEEIIVEKPVSLALDEIVEGKYKIIEPEEIRNI
ncbi:MAG: DNA-directed RNA polymerase subunit omega [Lachnospiraceae bacterium]